MRELLGGYDPVIVFVDSEIEEAIRAMAGDLSALSQRYPSQYGIDWITFQYHLSLMQQDAPMGWNAPGFRMGGRIPMSVGKFTNCHSTPIRDWQRVKHMVTLRRDPAMRENYVHDAIGALAHYNKIAIEASPQLEELVMDDMMMVEYNDWSSQLDTLSDAIRTGTGVAAIPDSRMEERERQAREAEADLIQSIEDENEARARRNQKKRERKERRSHSRTQPSHHTVVLLDYHPPQEPSDEEGESVTRRLDFDEGSRAVSVREPDTPEELHQQPNQPSSPRGTSPPPDAEATGYDPGPQPVDVDAPERKKNKINQLRVMVKLKSLNNLHLTAISQQGMMIKTLEKVKTLLDSLLIHPIHQNHRMIQMIQTQFQIRKRMRRKKTRRINRKGKRKIPSRWWNLNRLREAARSRNEKRRSMRPRS